MRNKVMKIDKEELFRKRINSLIDMLDMIVRKVSIYHAKNIYEDLKDIVHFIPVVAKR